MKASRVYFFESYAIDCVRDVFEKRRKNAMMGKHPLIFNIQKFCVHDGPGIRTTVFFKGCPLRCQWCSNPESQDTLPELQFFPDKCIGCGQCVGACVYGAITDAGFDRAACRRCMACAQVCKSGARMRVGEEKSAEEIFKDTAKDIVFYKNSGGGITFSGGEPMLYPGFIRDVARRYEGTGITVAVETCGQAPWSNFQQALPFLDILLFDVKVMDSGVHQKYCGVGNEQILDNLARAAEEAIRVIVRMPVLPGINDGEQNVERTALFMKEHGLGTVHLLPYHNLALFKYDSLGRNYPLGGMQAPTDAKMREIQRKFEKFGLMAGIGG